MIRYIYFDVGGVVVKDFSHSAKFSDLKSLLGLNGPSADMFDTLYHKFEHDFCLHKSIEDLLPQLKQFFPQLGSYGSLLEQFVIRFETNPSLTNLLPRISVPCGLLTNQFVGMYESIAQHGLLPNYAWHTIVDSSVVGMAKPDMNIYEYAQSQVSASPEQILFVDNTQENLEPAKQLGWQTFWYRSEDYDQSSIDLEKYLIELGVL